MAAEAVTGGRLKVQRLDDLLATACGDGLLVGMTGKSVEKGKQDFSIAYFMVALAVMFILQYALLTKQVETISYSQFKALVKKGQVAELVVRDKTISGSIKVEGLREIFPAEKIAELGEGAKKPVPFLVVRVEDERLTAELEAAGVPFKGEVTSDWLPTVLSWVVPIIIFFVLWNFLINRMGAAPAAD